MLVHVPSKVATRVRDRGQTSTLSRMHNHRLFARFARPTLVCTLREEPLFHARLPQHSRPGTSGKICEWSICAISRSDRREQNTSCNSPCTHCSGAAHIVTFAESALAAYPNFRLSNEGGSAARASPARSCPSGAIGVRMAAHCAQALGAKSVTWSRSLAW
jgi:hypothetical protein